MFWMNRRTFFTSLRARLTFLVLVATLPVFGIVVHDAARAREEARSQAITQMLNLVRVAAAEQQSILDITHTLLAGLARSPQLRPGQEQACQTLLAAVLPLHPIYTNLGVVDPEGRVVCSAQPLPMSIDAADQEWFQRTLATRDFTIGSYQIGNITGKQVIVAAYPILDGDELLGVVAAGLDIQWIGNIVQDIVPPQESVFMLVDQKGTLLVRFPAEATWTGQPAPERELMDIVLSSHEEGVVEAPGVNGEPYLFVYTPLYGDERPMGYAVMGMPVALVDAPAQVQLERDLGLVGGIALLALAIAWFGNEFLVIRVLNRLLEATQRLREGDFQVRTGIDRGVKELVQLAQAFDAMAMSLEQHLRMFNDLFESAPDALLVINAKGYIVKANRQTKDVFACAPEDLLGRPIEDILPSVMKHILEGPNTTSAPSRERIEVEARRLHGDPFPAEISLNWIEGEDETLALVMVRDITERKRDEEERARQMQHLAALYVTARELSVSLDWDAVAAKVTRLCVESFGLRLAWLGMAEEDGRVSVISQYPTDHPYPQRITVRWDDTPEGRGPTGRAIRSGSAQVVSNLQQDPHFASWREEAEKFQLRSSAALPLISRGRTLGALNLYSDRTDFFTPDMLETLQALANQAAASLENARLYTDAQRRLRTIQALRNIDRAITGSLDPFVTMQVLLDEVTNQLGVDAAAILLLNPHFQILNFAAGRGFRTKAIERSHLRLGEGWAGLAALDRRVVTVPDLRNPPAPFLRQELVQQEGFVSYSAAPMVARGQILGVLETYHRTPIKTDREWVELLEALAGQAAIAIDNARLFAELERSNTELRLAYEATIEGWSQALELRDRETQGHTLRVTELTLLLAQRLGLKDQDLVHIRRGALLHDIGKLGIPDAVLLKPGRLTDEEWEIMKRHPQIAYDLLKDIEYLRPALAIPLCHHERWDGTGYPRGLKGEEIPLAARIFAVVDVYDALTSDRPYRKAWSREAALAYIREQAGKHFDPKVVQAFLEMAEEGLL